MEEPRGENRGERALREQRDGCDGGGKMAERVGEREVAAELRDEAEADESGQRAMAWDCQRRRAGEELNTKRKIVPEIVARRRKTSVPVCARTFSVARR